VDGLLVAMLDHTRQMLGLPMTINSGYRCANHNGTVGGSSTSSHLLGLAVDIGCENSDYRFKLIKALQAAGFQRIGVAATFVHVDIDTDKSRPVMWTY
jgi:uncharacterized protein YcbK (DUF882 family)